MSGEDDEDVTSGTFYSSLHFHNPRPEVGDSIVIRCGKVKYAGTVEGMTTENIVIHTEWEEVQ